MNFVKGFLKVVFNKKLYCLLIVNLIFLSSYVNISWWISFYNKTIVAESVKINNRNFLFVHLAVT